MAQPETVRLVTWNVNSLRARLERVEEWLREVEPDVVCMQETKLTDEAFPAMTFAALGYESAHYGQGQWNGVAILSKIGIDDVVTNFADGIEPDPDARIITATCGGIRTVCCYVPNGRSLDDDHYTYKLSWLERLRAHLDAVASPDQPVLVTGDFNIAPDDRDVYNPAKHIGATHVSEPERHALANIEAWGLSDVFRDRYSEDRLYSWWDYRAGDFHQGRGMRIDLLLASQPLADRVTWSIIDRNARKGTSPSDHAPVLIDVTRD